MSHFFFLFYNHHLHGLVFLVSQLWHVLTYYRIQFLKTYRIKIDAVECDASAENSILSEISCCTKPDIDLTERKIATGDSDRVNWVAMSFNKVGTTIFALGDNRAPQCNVRIANRGSSRSAGRIPQQNPFPPFPRRHWNSMLLGLQSQNSVLLRASLSTKLIREHSMCLIKTERKILSVRYYCFSNCF